MSSPLPNSSEAGKQANKVNSWHLVGESLEPQFESIHFNDPHSNVKFHQPSRIKLSARGLLERLDRRRLDITRINFTAGVSEAGRGGHGEVVVATLAMDDDSGSSELGKQVAVKKFMLSHNVDEEKFLRIFANELRVLDELDHPNIIKIIGFVEDMKRCVAWLVFPWEANGNVREFLLSGKWELPERISLIKDVTSGLEYLHTRKTPIRHGDLKSLNILVNSGHRAVITDFGSARFQTEVRGLETTNGPTRRHTASTSSSHTAYDGCPEITIVTTNAELTLTGPSWSFRWAAPEVLNEEELCLASDIWALGWIAWEVMTDNYPFPEVRTNQLITIKVITGLLPSLYDDDQLSQIGPLCYVMARCWKSDPTERLSATEFRSALQFVPSAIPAAKNDGTSQIRSAALLVEMGIIHRFRERHKEALKFFEEGLAIARLARDQEMMAYALSLSADCHKVLGYYDKAEESCSEALFICGGIGDKFGRANALHRLGEIQQARSNHVQAGKSFNEALAIYTDVGHGLGRANALERLGEAQQAQSNYVQAEKSFNEALAISKHIGNVLGQANALHRLGETHQARSNHVRAEEYFDEALAIYTSTGNSLGQASTLLRLGKTHQARANYAKAEILFTQSLAMFRRVGAGFGRANVLVGLGEVLIRQARYSEAKSALDDAAQISEQIGYRWANIRSKKLLSEALEAEKSSVER